MLTRTSANRTHEAQPRAGGFLKDVRQWFTVSYDYDLISGNVKQVTAPRTRHRYIYDDDNRLTAVWTADAPAGGEPPSWQGGAGGGHIGLGEGWQQDAKYFYYPHGPLARIELGHDKVQGIDFAYTLHGWLKAVNSDIPDPSFDMGHDGPSGADSPPLWGGAGGGVNRNVARDAFAYSLHYYPGDYLPKGTATPIASATGSAHLASAPPLYNGNISRMVTTLPALSNSPIVGAAYRYDRLNRLVRAVQHSNVTYDSGYEWGATGHTTDSESDYYADYTYDSNGNLRQLRRNAHGTANAMDDLFYFYKAHNNQLTRVTDEADDNEAWNDIKQLPVQAADNYQYDLDGNLTSDYSEKIDQILWNASGKVRGIRREEGSEKDDLQFLYDALGNRYGKVAIKKDGSGNELPLSEADITMYIRDAQGNPLEIYDYSFEDLGDNEYRESLKLNERIFYGSSRIATETDINEEVAYAEFSVSSGDYPFSGNPFSKQGVSSTLVEPDAKKFSLIRGRKHFELTNHLGNVLATVSDKRFPIDGKYSWVLGAAGTGDYNFVDGIFVYDEDNGNYTQDEAPDGTIDFYMPKVTMANRYYPFGMVQPNSDNISGNTRYGFNGMERDGEVTSGSYTTPFRELDARLGGRWWSRDPIVKPWESPYAGFANNPICYADPSGLDPERPISNPEAGETHDLKTFDATTGWTLPEAVADGGIAGECAPEMNPSASSPKMSSNPIHRNMQTKGITSYGKGIHWGEGLGRQTEFSKGLDVFPKMLAVGLAPMAIPSLALIAPALSPLAPLVIEGSAYSAGARIGSVGLDAVGQYAANLAFGDDWVSAGKKINATSLLFSALNPGNSAINLFRNGVLSSGLEFRLNGNYMGLSSSSGTKELGQVAFSAGVSTGTSLFLSYSGRCFMRLANDIQVSFRTTQAYFIQHGLSPTHPSLMNIAFTGYSLQGIGIVVGSEVVGKAGGSAASKLVED